MAYLVLVRHGQSEWNLLNKWTGHVDVELTERGKEEAKKAALLLKDIPLHKAHTSDLKRAQKTLEIILDELNSKDIDVKKDAAIKERDYGDLTGMDKGEARKKFGEEKFMLYRRSWDVAPPKGESLKDTADRAIPYYENHVLKDLKNGNNVIVAAHGNTLRAIIKHLEDVAEHEIPSLEIGTGVVYVYEIDEKGKIISKEIRDHSKEQ
ncbi:MAG: 2,3-diphosphoglycerate-dependent phosphoglycerate mutase [Patescibacteria group bacterium]